MTMSMYSSYSPEDFHPEEDIFGEKSYTCTHSQNIYSASVMTLGHERPVQIYKSDHSISLPTSQSPVRVVLDRTRGRPRRVGVPQVALPPVHVAARRPVGQCYLPEGGQRHIGGAEEESPVPVHAAHRHTVLAAAARAGRRQFDGAGAAVSGRPDADRWRWWPACGGVWRRRRHGGGAGATDDRGR